MSFHALTAEFQEQLDEFTNTEINEGVMEDVRDILSEYCFAVEFNYGVEMRFETWFDEATSKLRYRLKPVSELDDALLSVIVKNEAFLGPVSMSLH